MHRAISRAANVENAPIAALCCSAGRKSLRIAMPPNEIPTLSASGRTAALGAAPQFAATCLLATLRPKASGHSLSVLTGSGIDGQTPEVATPPAFSSSGGSPLRTTQNSPRGLPRGTPTHAEGYTVNGHAGSPAELQLLVSYGPAPGRWMSMALALTRRQWAQQTNASGNRGRKCRVLDVLLCE